jgi:hypothetical protein
MTVTELEQRWSSLKYTGNSPYKSLLISPDCIPGLFVALDVKGFRHLILQVPSGISVHCPQMEIQNLSLQWHEQTRFIVIGLRNEHFLDLYNELVLSLYSKIKDERRPEKYTRDFIESFNKWAQFFDETFPVRLSDAEVKGILGELIALKYYLSTLTSIPTNDILTAWQGPYNRAQDFIFPSANVEVKAKDTDQAAVSISSEFQLQPATGKHLQLAIVEVLRNQEGINLSAIIKEVKAMIAQKGADLTIFLKSLAKVSLIGNTAALYDGLRWQPVSIAFYDCNDNSGFPKIMASEISDAINSVKYNLTVSLLENFIIERILF